MRKAENASGDNPGVRCDSLTCRGLRLASKQHLCRDETIAEGNLLNDPAPTRGVKAPPHRPARPAPPSRPAESHPEHRGVGNDRPPPDDPVGALMRYPAPGFIKPKVPAGKNFAAWHTASAPAAYASRAALPLPMQVWLPVGRPRLYRKAGRELNPLHGFERLRITSFLLSRPSPDARAAS